MLGSISIYKSSGIWGCDAVWNHKTILHFFGKALTGAVEGSVDTDSAISTPTKTFSLHWVPSDLAGEERDLLLPTAHVTLIFPRYINN